MSSIRLLFSTPSNKTVAQFDETAAKTLVAKEREVMHIIIASASDNVFFIILPLSLNQ